jgi:hypothetical protein
MHIHTYTHTLKTPALSPKCVCMCVQNSITLHRAAAMARRTQQEAEDTALAQVRALNLDGHLQYP